MLTYTSQHPCQADAMSINPLPRGGNKHRRTWDLTKASEL